MAAILAEYRFSSTNIVHCSPILLSKTPPTDTRREGTADTDRQSFSCISQHTRTCLFSVYAQYNRLELTGWAYFWDFGWRTTAHDSSELAVASLGNVHVNSQTAIVL
jgi:hypothetical protein